MYIDEDKVTDSHMAVTKSMNQLDTISEKSCIKDDNTEIEQEEETKVHLEKMDESSL